MRCSLNLSILWLQVSVEVKEGEGGDERREEEVESETYNLRRRFWCTRPPSHPTRTEWQKRSFSPSTFSKLPFFFSNVERRVERWKARRKVSFAGRTGGWEWAERGERET